MTAAQLEAETVRDGDASLTRAIEGLAGIRAILDGMRSGALPTQFWVLVKMALADASAYRDGDEDMPELSALYDEALAALGGPPDGKLWDALLCSGRSEQPNRRGNRLHHAVNLRPVPPSY